LAERLSKQGVTTREVTFTPSNLQAMATVTIEAFSERAIELYDHDELLSDLRALRVVEKSYGWRLEPQRDGSGHGDRAIGLALGLLSAKELDQYATGELMRTPHRDRHSPHESSRLLLQSRKRCASVVSDGCGRACKVLQVATCYDERPSSHSRATPQQVATRSCGEPTCSTIPVAFAFDARTKPSGCASDSQLEWGLKALPEGW
jgi:hypothetical protein